MPYKMKKVDGFSVSGPSGTHAKGTSKEKAMRQMNLLHGVEHGWKPTGAPPVESSHYEGGEGKRQRDEFHKRKRK